MVDVSRHQSAKSMNPDESLLAAVAYRCNGRDVHRIRNVLSVYCTAGALPHPEAAIIFNNVERRLRQYVATGSLGEEQDAQN